MKVATCRLQFLLVAVVIFTSACANDLSKDNSEFCSPFYKNKQWGKLPTIPFFSIDSQDNSLTCFDYYSLTTDIYSAFSSLSLQYPDLITGKAVGNSSDNQVIMSYHLGRFDNPDSPTFIIVCAQHGFEKNSTFGTYAFVKEVVTNQDNLLGRYLLNNVHIIIIPVSNTFGFDHCYYKNAQEVNLNRNWPVIGWNSSNIEKNSIDYPGLNPLDQPETFSINNNILLDNLDASIIIDFHTYGEGLVLNNNRINWIIIPTNQSLEIDSYYAGIFDVVKSHFEKVTTLFWNKYSMRLDFESTNLSIGLLSICDYFRTNGCLNNYGVQKDILSITFEGFNGFPEDKTPYMSGVAEANAELLGNFILSFIEYYSKKTPLDY